MKRKNHLKTSPLAYFTAHFDITAVGFNDAVRGRESQTGSALALSRIERLKDTGDDFGHHAGAVVGHPELRGRSLDTSTDFDDATLAHSIDGVEDQIQDNFA